MPNQASGPKPRTTRNSRGLRGQPVESDGSNSAAPSRRTRKARARRARSNSPNAPADTSTGSVPPTAHSDTVAAAEPAEPAQPTNSPVPSQGAAAPALATVSEEEPQAPSPRAETPALSPAHSPTHSPIAPVVHIRDDHTKSPDRRAESPSPSALPAVPAAPANTDDHNESSEEEESDETPLFIARRKQEGHKFGRELYAAIEAERFAKECACPLPPIYQSREEAEAGTGVFRFYYAGPDVRVFMRKDDEHWHCQCYKRENAFKLAVVRNRKRKAEATELELASENSAEIPQDGVTIVRAVDEQQRQEAVRPMLGSITRTLKKMTTSVKSWFSQLGARITQATHEVIESRRYDAAGRHIVVKRFKRQFCLPENSDAPRQEDPFEQLPYFEWASTTTGNIGEPFIRDIQNAMWRQIHMIRDGLVAFAPSIDILKAHYKEDEVDLDLSIAIHHLLTKHFDEFNEETCNEAADMYRLGAATVVEFIDTIYLNPDILPVLKANFPKPPKRLDYFGNIDYKMRTRQAGDFLTWLLTQKDLFNINGEYELAITKMILDMDAVHKQEVLPSLVVFPGYNAEAMPGSFPVEGAVLETVPAEDVVIEPVYELKHPDSRLPTSDDQRANTPAFSTPPPPKVKGILKKEPKEWPEHVPSPRADESPSSRPRKLQFRNPVAHFTPPKKQPKRRMPTFARSPIGKAAKRSRVNPENLRTLLPKLREVDYYGTKFAEFLDETRRQLYNRPSFMARSPPPAPGDRWRKQEAGVKARLAMTPEERHRERDLFVRDLELDENGEVVQRKLLVPDSELLIATRQLEDIELAQQLRADMQAAAERERLKMAKMLAEEKQRRIEAEKRQLEEERRQREEEKRRKLEAERLKREKELRAEQEAERLRKAEERVTRLGLRAPTRPVIEPITAEWRTKVLGIAAAQPNVELAKTLEGVSLTRRDFEEKLLPPTAWLNDNVITGSILYVGESINSKAGATAQNPRCATFTSYFWPRLESAGPAQCGRLMRRAGVRKDNFLSIDSILIPICSGAHWTLAVVLPGRRMVAHMDSLRGGRGNPSVTQRLLDWVIVTLDDQFVETEWEVVNLEAPVQTNGWDCGVFAVTNALCLGLGLDPNESYSAQQLTLQRQRLAAVLLNGGFKGDFDLDGL